MSSMFYVNLMIQLFIPSARVYSTTDIIPFHLQLSGSLGSLQSFLMPSRRHGEHAAIRVILLREVVVEIRGKDISRNNVIAEGKLCEIPPSPCESQDSVHLDWEGEVRCSSDTSVGSFNAGSVAVKVCLLWIFLNYELGTHFDYLGLHPS